MPHFNVAKAVRSNPIYGRHVCWIYRFGEVIAALDCKPNSAVAFAECVANWQGSNGLKSDGMFGPKTWGKARARYSIRCADAAGTRVAAPVAGSRGLD